MYRMSTKQPFSFFVIDNKQDTVFQQNLDTVLRYVDKEKEDSDSDSDEEWSLYFIALFNHFNHLFYCFLIIIIMHYVNCTSTVTHYCEV